MQDSIANGMLKRPEKKPLNSLQKFHLVMKVVASVAVIADGLYYAITQPGPMDCVNAIVGGLAFLGIWVMHERTR